MISRFLLAGAAATMLAAASACAPPYVMRDGPIVQRDGAGSLYRMSREEGLRHLQGLAKKGAKEDIMVYCGSDIWVDLGTMETAHSVSTDPFLLPKLARDAPVFEFYHKFCPSSLSRKTKG